jgi:tetratricopeptide (TPR) repeat protein
MSATGFLDRYGLPLSSHSAAAVDAYIAGVDHVLALTAGADEALQSALVADEGFAMAHAARALFLQLQGKPQDAAESSARARSLMDGVTEREQRHIEAVAATVGGEMGRADELITEQLAVYPRDALILRQAAFAISFSGAMHPREQLLDLLERVAPAYGDDWFFLSLHAMALQDVNRLEEARRLADRALVQRPRSASSVHPVAHVFYESDDHSSGVAFLEDWMGEYESHAPFYTHLNWHLALFALAQGQYGRAMALYDAAIQPAVASGRSVVFDAPSLLWRCELYGAAEALRPWEPVRTMIGQMVARPGAAFPDSHAAITYAACGDTAAIDAMIDALRDLDAKGHPTAGAVILPWVQGVAAFARGEYVEALRWLEPIKNQLERLGGSHAQNEVFEDTLLEAYLRAGRFDDAEALLRVRLNRRPSARDYFWLGRAQAGAGRADEAQGDFAEAEQRWRDADPDSQELAVLRRARERLSA